MMFVMVMMFIVAESPLGMQIVSTGSSATIKLWSVRTTECTATFDEHDDKVNSGPALCFTVFLG
jgi:WD40 repeat protein